MSIAGRTPSSPLRSRPDPMAPFPPVALALPARSVVDDSHFGTTKVDVGIAFTPFATRSSHCGGHCRHDQLAAVDRSI